MEESKLLTAADVTRILGYKNVNTVWRLVRARKIDTIVLGQRRKFTQEAVDKFIKEHTLEAKS
jgi:predicted SAM-dependent methyltransferase